MTYVEIQSPFYLAIIVVNGVKHITVSLGDLSLSFGQLPETGERCFVWNSSEWWKWFRAYRTKPSIDSVHERLRKYDSFVSFHCARPLDVSTFYEFGLKLGDIESLNQRAREIFLSDQYPEITSSLLEKVIAGTSRLHDQTLFAIIDEREISGHYLIYGSEHLCGIGASLNRELGFDCRQILKFFGTPTVFRILIPRYLIPDNQLYALAEYLMDRYWDERNRMWPPKNDWSWILKQEIPGKFVLDHFHPEVIPDPLMQDIPYRHRDNFPCFI